MIKKYQLLGSVGPVYSIIPPVLRRSARHSRQPLQSVLPSKIEISPALAKGERGGIIGIGAKIKPSQQDNTVDIVTRGNDEGVIKLALLFVDKIDKPTNNLMGFGEDGLADVTGLGLGYQTMVTYTEGLTFAQTSTYVWDTYKLLNEREPGRWSLWQQRDTPVIPEELLTPDLAFQLELTNGLIVPHPSTPYEDVIAFKERHLDELIDFRDNLEKFVIRLSKEGDPRAANLELEGFERSLSNYLKKARESNVRRAIASLTTEMDWAAAIRESGKEILLGGAGGGLLSIAQSLTLGGVATAIGGGILTALSVKSAAGLKKPEPNAFRYLARIEREYGD